MTTRPLALLLSRRSPKFFKSSYLSHSFSHAASQAATQKIAKVRKSRQTAPKLASKARSSRSTPETVVKTSLNEEAKVLEVDAIAEQKKQGRARKVLSVAEPKATQITEEEVEGKVEPKKRRKLKTVPSPGLEETNAEKEISMEPKRKTRLSKVCVAVEPKTKLEKPKVQVVEEEQDQKPEAQQPSKRRGRPSVMEEGAAMLRLEIAPPGINREVDHITQLWGFDYSNPPNEQRRGLLEALIHDLETKEPWKSVKEKWPQDNLTAGHIRSRVWQVRKGWKAKKREPRKGFFLTDDLTGLELKIFEAGVKVNTLVLDIADSRWEWEQKWKPIRLSDGTLMRGEDAIMDPRKRLPKSLNLKPSTSVVKTPSKERAAEPSGPDDLSLLDHFTEHVKVMRHTHTKRANVKLKKEEQDRARIDGWKAEGLNSAEVFARIVKWEVMKLRVKLDPAFAEQVGAGPKYMDINAYSPDVPDDELSDDDEDEDEDED